MQFLNPRRRAFRYTLLYLVIAGLWILFSDRILVSLVHEPQQLTFWQTVKGWMFVLAMACLFYIALRRGELLVEEVQEHAKEWKITFDEAPNPMWVTDLSSLKFLAVNDAAVQLYGYSRPEFLQMTLKAVTDLAGVEGYISGSQRGDPEISYRGTHQHTKKDGAVLYVDVFVEGLTFGGRPARLAIINDMTLRKQQDEALRQSQAQLSKAHQMAKMGHWSWDIVTDLGVWSVEINEMLHLPRQQQTASLEFFFNHILPEDLEWVKQNTQDALTGKKPLDYVHRMKRRDGSIVWVRHLGETIFDQNGQPMQMFGIMQDITEQKQVEEALRRNEARLAYAQHIAKLGNWSWDLRAKVNEWSDTVLEMCGVSREQFDGGFHAFLRLVHPDDQKLINKTIRAALKGKKVLDFEHRILRPDGKILWVRERGEMVYDAQGAPLRMIGTIQDITDQKQTEEALRESEYLLLESQRVGQIGSYRLDVQSGIWMSTAVLDDIFGIDASYPKTVDGWLNIVHPEQRAEMTSYFQHHVLDNKMRFDKEYRIVQLSSSKERWVHGRGELRMDKDGKPIAMMGTIQDITERKESELAIQQQIERLRSLHEIDAIIASTFDLSFGLDFILNHVLVHLKANAAAVIFYDRESQLFDYRVCKGFYKSVAGQDVYDLHPLILKMMDVPEPVGYSDLTQVNDRVPSFYQAEGFRAVHSAPLIAKGQLRGLLQVFHRQPFYPQPEWLDYFETLAGQMAIAIDNVTLYSTLQRSNMELRMAYDATIEGWSRALDLRDKETEGHTLRVTELTLRLAQAVGLSEEAQKHIRWGALLHDIGKMGVPDQILLKDGPLTASEWTIMKQHPVYALELLTPISFLKKSLDIPSYHHEKWDGTGYPYGLCSEQIPLSARLFALADVWDALISDRPYRKAWTREKTSEYIRSLSGIQFDPDLVEIFLRIVSTKD